MSYPHENTGFGTVEGIVSIAFLGVCALVGIAYVVIREIKKRVGK